MSPLEHTQTGRVRYGLLVAAGTVVIGCLTVVVLVISAHGSGTPPDPARRHATTPAASTSAAFTPSADASAAPLSSPPSAVTWTVVGQVGVPASGNAAPYKVDGRQATCFAHSPAATPNAAAQICNRCGLHDGRSCWEPTLTRQFLPPADRDALLRLLMAADARKAPGPCRGECSDV